MAKVKGPLFSIVAMGTIDNDLTYRKRKGIDDVKKYIKTVNPDTPGQQVQKGYFKNAIDAWSIDGYSEADKLAWDKFAKTKKVITSGFNRFTSSKIVAEKEGFTWNKLTNCTIYDVTAAGFKVDIDVSSDLSGILYIGVSKYSMLREIVGVFSVNKYTFTVTGLQDDTKYYFYIKSTSVGEGARSGIYSQYHVGGFIPSPIDIGSPAINDLGTFVSGYTIISKGNPANGSGEIKSVEIWANVNMTGVAVAIFNEVSENNFTARDHEVLSDIPAGSKTTRTVNLDVVAGDVIGIYYSGGKIEYRSVAGAGLWYCSGNQTSCVDKAFTDYGDTKRISLYGTGETTS